jgi:hypothetical protein
MATELKFVLACRVKLLALPRSMLLLAHETAIGA